MKALVYDGPGRIDWREHPDPVLQRDTDLLLRVTKTTICGSDTHIVKAASRTPPRAPCSGTRASAWSRRSAPR